MRNSFHSQNFQPKGACISLHAAAPPSPYQLIAKLIRHLFHALFICVDILRLIFFLPVLNICWLYIPIKSRSFPLSWNVKWLNVRICSRIWILLSPKDREFCFLWTWLFLSETGILTFWYKPEWHNGMFQLTHPSTITYIWDKGTRLKKHQGLLPATFCKSYTMEQRSETTPAPESRVLIIMTGGTVCMTKSPNGFVPARTYISKPLLPSFNAVWVLEEVAGAET